MVKLEITLKRDGSLSITGPIEDQILSLGLLEMAKHIVIQQAQRKQEVRQEVRPIQIMPNLPNLNQAR